MKIRIAIHDLIIHAAFIVLGLMALHYSAERLYADASYYLFHVVNSGWFHIEHHRFILAFSQILPLLGVKAGLSLHTILHLYSIGHVFFFYVLFLISRYRLHDRGAGLLLVLIQVLCLEMGYFTPMFELYYSTGFLVLFAALLWKNGTSIGHYAGLLFLSLIILSGHPMAILLWLFTIGLHGIAFRKTYLRKYLGCVVLLLVFLLLKALTASTYEAFKVGDVFKTYRVMPFGGAYVSDAVTFLFRYYKELFVLFAFSLLAYGVHREIRTLIYVLLAFLGLLVVIHGVHYGFQHSRYQEQVYFPLTWIVGFPMVLGMYRHSWSVRWKDGLLLLSVLLIGVKMLSIVSESQSFTLRTAMMREQIRQSRDAGWRKNILGEANVTRRTSVDPNWSYGIETLLFSAGDGPEDAVTIALDQDLKFEQNAARLQQSDFILRKWDIKPVSWLNARYFNLPSTAYHNYTTIDLPPTITDTIARAINMSIQEDDVHVKGGQMRPLRIEIANQSLLTIPADTAFRVYVCYHWKRGDDLITWDGMRTPLDMDIPPASTLVQSIEIAAPEVPGHYILLLDLVAEGRRWFGIDAAKEVWVY